MKRSYQSVVQFSTGVGSAEVLLREVERVGVKNVLALTADTLVEDEDNWRFAREVIRQVGCRWVTLAEGRSPMKVGLDRRLVPNNRAAICSRILKRELLREWVDANCDPETATIALGFDWTEPHRMKASEQPWVPYRITAPLMDPPLMTKADILDAWRARGIEPPRLYAQGFSHANCLAPETRFITDEGMKSLQECEGRSVKVLGHGGGWHPARIESFGRQELLEISLSRYGDTKVVHATADHLWPVRKAAGRTDYRWRPTTALQPGHRLAGTPRPADWRVVSVRRTGRVDTVLCAVVPEGNCFTLEGNLLTHNCGGACVRGGQAQWRLLLTVNRDRYLDWEADEQAIRTKLDRDDVAILRDRTNATTTPVSLRQFRERIESQPSLFDPSDWGACGCFMDDELEAQP